MDRKKPARKAEPPAKRGIAWPRWTGFRGMTVRDWLQLLIVPLALVGIGLVFDLRQQGIEDQRAERERELAEQRAQDEALQAYLDQMSTLLLEKDLRDSEEDSEVRTLARARTATVIQRLDLDRTSSVIAFVDAAGLIEKGESSPHLLAGADLHGAHLQGLDLAGADLSYADLRYADLDDADLHDADLHKANLSWADMHAVNLIDANLNWASLGHADLGRSKDAPLRRSATLLGANLKYAGLARTDMRGAVLHLFGNPGKWGRDADLSNAWMLNTDLNYASVSNEQLAQTLTVAGATLPNGEKAPTGQKYEEWRKSLGKDEESRSPS